jgi:hypothetical protein
MVGLLTNKNDITANDMGINEGGMVNGVLSRKVEITLNSAVSLVQTVQPLLFIPCCKSGCGELRGVTRRSRNAFEPQLAYNNKYAQLNIIYKHTQRHEK